MSGATWLTTAAALGAVYAMLGLAVVAVARVSRTLHLAVGPVLVVSALTQAAAVSLGLPLVARLVVGLGVAVVASLLLAPILAGRRSDATVRLVGLLVAGGVLELLTARVLGGAARRLPPLVAGDELLSAVVVGAPVAVALALALRDTRWGRQVRLVGGSAAAAERVGVSPARVVLVTLAVAGLVAGTAAALVTPIAFVGVGAGLGLTVRAVAAALVVGSGGATRALGGGLLLGAIEATALTVASGPAVELSVLATLLVLLVAPRPDRSRGWGRAW